MAIWNENNIIMTDIGKLMLSHAQASGSGIAISSAVVGGSFTALSQLHALTAIPTIKDNLVFSGNSSFDENGSRIKLQLNNTDLLEEYSICQIGIYARHPLVDNNAERLYMVAQCDDPADVMPTFADTPLSIYFDFLILHDTSTEVTIALDDTGLVHEEDLDPINTRIDDLIPKMFDNVYTYTDEEVPWDTFMTAGLYKIIRIVTEPTVGQYSYVLQVSVSEEDTGQGLSTTTQVKNYTHSRSKQSNVSTWEGISFTPISTPYSSTKGLSKNDFTDILKTRLEDLIGFDFEYDVTTDSVPYNDYDEAGVYKINHAQSGTDNVYPHILLVKIIEEETTFPMQILDFEFVRTKNVSNNTWNAWAPMYTAYSATKGLSKNDFTDILKTKLDNVACFDFEHDVEGNINYDLYTTGGAYKINHTSIAGEEISKEVVLLYVSTTIGGVDNISPTQVRDIKGVISKRTISENTWTQVASPPTSSSVTNESFGANATAPRATADANGDTLTSTYVQKKGKNKVGCGIGDSISIDARHMTNVLSNLNSTFVYHKHGYSGFTLASSTNCILGTQADWEVADVYTLLAGTNDFQFGIKLGSILDYISPPSEEDVTTYYSALKRFVTLCLAKNSEAQFLLMSPMYRNNDLEAHAVNNREDLITSVTASDAHVVAPIVEIPVDYATGLGKRSITFIRLGAEYTADQQSNIPVTITGGTVTTASFVPKNHEFFSVSNNKGFANGFSQISLDSDDEGIDMFSGSFNEVYYKDTRTNAINWKLVHDSNDDTLTFTVKYYTRLADKIVQTVFYDSDYNEIAVTTTLFNEDIKVPKDCRIKYFQVKILDTVLADVPSLYIRQGNTLYDFADAVKEVCEYEGFKFCDLLREGGLNNANLSLYTFDGLHPNQDGGDIMAPLILSKFMTLNI